MTHCFFSKHGAAEKKKQAIDTTLLTLLRSVVVKSRMPPRPENALATLLDCPLLQCDDEMRPFQTSLQKDNKSTGFFQQKLTMVGHWLSPLFSPQRELHSRGQSPPLPRGSCTLFGCAQPLKTKTLPDFLSPPKAYSFCPPSSAGKETDPQGLVLFLAADSLSPLLLLLRDVQGMRSSIFVHASELRTEYSSRSSSTRKHRKTAKCTRNSIPYPRSKTPAWVKPRFCSDAVASAGVRNRDLAVPHDLIGPPAR